MQADYQACEDRVLAHEGSEYTDGVNPYDPGGPTRWGITIADAKAFWMPSATPNDVRTMPRSVAQQIYRPKYWEEVNADNLPAGVDDAVFDYGVNSGNSRAGKVLRRVLGLPDTNWHVTDEVIAEAKRRDPVALVNAICDERLKFLQSLRIWPIYKNGWSARIKEVRQFATQLAAHNASPVSNPVPLPPVAPALPTGKGRVQPPPTVPVTTSGGAIAVALATASHWLGAHPAATAAIVIATAIGVGVIIALLHQQVAAKQDAPVPNIPIVPVK